MKKLELLDVFSYSCMNCQRSLKYIQKLHDAYARYGLRVTLLHPPEWEFEKRRGNIESFLKQNNISFPLVLDKNKKNIKKFRIDFWPTQILVNRGEMIYKHVGEGDYQKLEKAIQKNLGVAKKPIFSSEPIYSKYPTLYPGKKKGGLQAISNKIESKKIYGQGFKQHFEYIENEKEGKNQVMLQLKTMGTKVFVVARSLNKESSIIVKTKQTITIDTAKKAMKSSNKKVITKKMNAKGKTRKIKIGKPLLYELISFPKPAKKIITLEFEGKIALYAFAFQ